MFERFTGPARQAVVLAQEEARQRHADRIRSEHVLLGVCRVPHTPGGELLLRWEVTPDSIDAALSTPLPSDHEALAMLGIDLDEVRRRTDATFGPGALDRTMAGKRRGRWSRGHIPFSGDAKKVLELALREAVRLRHRVIGTEHILLGMLHTQTGRAQRILADHGLTLDGCRRAVDGFDYDAASG